ncbi:M56 family metallopeptidase [Algibacter sp. 2305UL17-15]|uniref:M56 family metallopeptidase n=1 Tax=Algibacter sp. 2305UL17-15 TaxID=3231268 RepID=UPI0034586359
MLAILLKSSACLALFMLFYKLCLEKTSAHTFKRFYLIAILIISMGIPFITFTEYVVVEIQQPQFSDVSALQNNATPQNAEISETKTIGDYLPTILWTIYALGVILFSFRFFKNLFQLFSRIRLNPRHKNKNFIIVLLEDLVTPHTFFKYIFLNKTNYEQNKIPQEVLLHEQTHAKQKHALDILYIEILQILFWFNPLLYFIKKDIKLNHEFLADRAVLNQGIDASTYQNTLLSFSANTSYSSLANAINYSSIKKRFTIMKTQTSRTANWLRSLVVLPLLAILIYGFSQKITVEESQNSNKNQIIEVTLEEGEGATEAMMQEYNDFMEKYNEDDRIGHSQSSRLMAIFSLMTYEQRRLVNARFSKFFKSSEIKPTPNHPTQAEFDSWKNSTDLVFFIDGEYIRKEELNNYNRQAIYSYSNSFAIDSDPNKGTYESKRYMLNTEKGHKKNLEDYRLRTYQQLLSKYKNEIKVFLNSDRPDNSELKILKWQLDEFYRMLEVETLEKANLLKAPEIPNINSIIKSKKSDFPERAIEYNTLAKKYNNQSLKERTHKIREIQRMFDLYKAMTKEEKASSEVFPYFHPKTLEHVKKYGLRVSKKTQKPIHTSNNHQISILINEDRQIFVDNQKVEFNHLSQKIIDIKNQLMATKYANKGDNFQIKYKLFVKVKIKGHATEQYLADLKSEIEKSKLIVSFITADSVSPIKDKINDTIQKKINIRSNEDIIYNYRQTTKITIDTIRTDTKHKKL